MKLNIPDSSLIYSSIQGTSIPFSIGDSSVIIDIIRKKIYSNPICTLVQEYLCNARDACVEAKKPVKIIVTLPTALNPHFIIRDYGLGMSESRVSDVFVRYGISTKRQTNNQAGCFGIGAKSGWAYTDSFIIEVFYDGVHSEYIADIGENREGRLLLFRKEDTSEENGVLIKIPVNQEDMRSFEMAYYRATLLWADRPSLSNRNITPNYPEPIIEVGDNIKIYECHSNQFLNEGVYLNALGVPYLHTLNKDNILHQIYDRSSLVISIKADPVKLDISANREGFSNKTYADKVIDSAIKQIKEYVGKEFESVPFSKYTEVYKNLGVISLLGDILFKDKPYYFRKNGDVVIKDAGHRKEYGYLLQIKSSNRFLKCTHTVKRSIDKVYLSKCKGLIGINNEGARVTPKLDRCTVRSIHAARLTFCGRKVPEYNHVLFQNNLCDSEYAEISEIMDATEYIEDTYLPEKKPNEKNKQNNDKTIPLSADPESLISVKLFVRSLNEQKRRRYSSSSSWVRGGTYTVSDLLDKTNIVVYTNTDCDSNLCEFFNYLRTIPSNLSLSISYVCAVNAAYTKLTELTNPRIIHEKDVPAFIESNEPLLKYLIMANHIRNVGEYSCKKIFNSKYVFTKINFEDLRSQIRAVTNNPSSVYMPKFIRDSKKESDLQKLFEIYPLIRGHLTEGFFDQHVQDYIDWIEKGI